MAKLEKRGGGQSGIDEASSNLQSQIKDLNTKIDNKTNIKDYNNGVDVRFGCSTSGMSTTNWLAAWDGSTLRAISPNQLFTYKDVSISITGLDNNNGTYYKEIAKNSFGGISLDKIIKIDLINYSGPWRMYSFNTYDIRLMFVSNYSADTSGTARIWYWNL